MKDLFFNRPGKILEGYMKGWYILFQKDEKYLGDSYLIIYRDSMNVISSEAYDDWVENLECLKKYIEECSWKIEWLDPKKANLFYKSES